LAHLLALFVHLELQAALHGIVVSEKLVELLLGGPPGPVAEAKCALLAASRCLAGAADLDGVARQSLIVEGQCRFGCGRRSTLKQCNTTVNLAGLKNTISWENAYLDGDATQEVLDVGLGS